jgi:general secretion pathway protein L
MARSERYRLVDVATGTDQRFSVVDGMPANAADSAVDDPVVALVPADRCSLVRVDIPEMSASRMARALRWAAEDSIAGDPEQQHVVPIRRAADGSLMCIVVAHTDMEQWLATLPARPVRMLPDAACLPLAAGKVSLMSAGDHVLARASEDVFDRIEPELLESLVPEFLAQAGEAARVVWLGDVPVPEVRCYDPEIHADAGSALEVLAPMALGASGRKFNLLAGEYAAREDIATARQWRLAGWLGALAVFLLLAGLVVDYVLLEREQFRLEQEIESRFAQSFPEISTLARPRAQAERALAELRGNSRDRFVRLMRAVSPVLSGAAGVQVDSISWADRALQLELETASLADLEALQRQLRAQDIDVALRNVEVLSDATRGRMHIVEGAP